ncbi:hypothetical protein [uncultured Pseudoalteromonas sp.]|uniref:hypothetical protein n=1 Tax=uncultured Pseudoalteromonas sp. TaxID=114053 RepID=UPI0030D79AAD|tara:strand:- start:189 stop:395 length:207 start_codon:yes stop_codon:yes gene_type:complete
MFAQIFLAILAVFLFYLGIVEKSILNIGIGFILIVVSVARYYAAKSGSSSQEEFDKWRVKRENKINDD